MPQTGGEGVEGGGGRVIVLCIRLVFANMCVVYDKTPKQTL